MKSLHQNKIEEFMQRAKQLPLDCHVHKPSIPDEDTRRLRASLILEECIETINGLGFGIQVEINEDGDRGGVLTKDRYSFFSLSKGPNLIDIVDGCADISVVTIGTLSACFVHDLDVLNEVDAANLRKFDLPTCPNCGSGVMTYNKERKLWVCHRQSCKWTMPREFGGHWRDDGKFKKGTSFVPPNIKQVLIELGWTE